MTRHEVSLGFYEKEELRKVSPNLRLLLTRTSVYVYWKLPKERVELWLVGWLAYEVRN